MGEWWRWWRCNTAFQSTSSSGFSRRDFREGDCGRTYTDFFFFCLIWRQVLVESCDLLNVKFVLLSRYLRRALLEVSWSRISWRWGSPKIWWSRPLRRMVSTWHFLVRWLYVCVVEIAIGSAGEGNSEAILETLLTHAVSIKLFPFLIELHQYWWMMWPYCCRCSTGTIHLVFFYM